MSQDLKSTIDNLNAAFAAFKDENDKHLSEHSADTKAKLDKINADLDRLQKEVDDAHIKAAAVPAGPALKDAEYTDAFSAHMRRGDVQASLNKGAATDGGYLAPVEWDRTITDKLAQVSPMREIASVQTISGAGFTKLFNLGGTASGWVGETDNRPETAAAKFKQLTYATGEIYANPSATQQMLDDSAINLEAWLAAEVQLEFSKQEGRAFWGGDGVNKPAGVLTYVEGGANATTHPFGAIKVVKSGAASNITSDSVLALIYDLPSALRGNARFALNNTTLRVIRTLKDGQGNYLWQPSFVAGQPSTLAGFAVTEVPDMPDVAANAHPVLFGDFKQGYLVVDRVGVRVLRDPFTHKPFVSFYTTKRVGGGLLNPEPLRALKVAA